MSGYRFICYYCDWNWPVHYWLPFDFSLARIAHRRHMRLAHGIKPVSFDGGYTKWVPMADD